MTMDLTNSRPDLISKTWTVTLLPADWLVKRNLAYIGRRRRRAGQSGAEGPGNKTLGSGMNKVIEPKNSTANRAKSGTGSHRLANPHPCAASVDAAGRRVVCG